MEDKLNQPVSPIRWMVTRETQFPVNITGPKRLDIVQDGFTKITAAKTFKDEQKELGLKIIPYYE